MNFGKVALCAAPALALMMAACGDETTTVYEPTGMKIVSDSDELEKCTASNVGEMVYVEDSSAVYYCADKKWQTLKGADGAKGEDGTGSVDSLIIRDTLVVKDTVFSKDTLVLENSAARVDTLIIRDSVYFKDTIHSIDTLVLNHVDTVVYTQKIPSVKYDCEKYDCVTTAYLNPSIEYGELLDERDNKVYRTVQIGDQVWMAQNLAYYDADDIALQGQSWCYYDSLDYCKTFGRLYSWSAAMRISPTFNTKVVEDGVVKTPHRGVCPTGYHVPNQAEWEELLAYVAEHNGAEGVGMSLKSRYLWQMRDSVSAGTDLFGFAVLPADDHVDGQTDKNHPGTSGFDVHVFRGSTIWNASEFSANESRVVGFSFMKSVVSMGSGAKINGFPVRCLKDSSL